MSKPIPRLYTALYCLFKGVTKGSKTTIHPGATISRPGGGRISIGSKCKIHTGVIVETHGGNIEIGDNCSINPLCVIYGHGGLKVGNGVRIAAHTVIIPSNHNFDRTDIPIFQQKQTKKGITIKDDVWIGTGARILDGITLAKGSIIAAGAVVTKSTEEYGIYGGVPAKKISSRMQN